MAEEVLAIRREQLGERHPAVATSLNNLAGLYEAQGRYGEAVAFLRQGLDIEEWNLDLNLATLPEAQRQAYVATIWGTSQFPISLHLQSAPTSPEAAQLALTTLLRRKGRILDAGTTSLQRLRQNLSPADQVTPDQLTDTRPETLPLDQYRAQLTALETQANQLEADLARRSATFRAETTPADIATIALSSLFTLLNASSELLSQGKDGFNQLLDRLQIPDHWREEAQFGAATLLTLILFTLWLALPRISRHYNHRAMDNLEAGQVGSAQDNLERSPKTTTTPMPTTTWAIFTRNCSNLTKPRPPTAAPC